MTRFDHLPAEVAAPLMAFDRRRRLYRLTADGAATLVLYLVLALVAMHLDRFVFMPVDARAALTVGAHLLASLWLFVCLARVYSRPATVAELAYRLEAVAPGDLQERLVTLDSVLRCSPDEPDAKDDDIRSRLLAQLEDETIAAAAELHAAELVHCPRMRRNLTAAAIGVAIYGLLALPAAYQFPLMLQRFYAPRADLPKPSFIQLRITPQDAVIGKGEELLIQAETSGHIPEVLRWLLRRAGIRDDQCLISIADKPFTEMVRVQRQLFVFSHPGAEESFTFRLRCGDAMSAGQAVEVVPRPTFSDWQVTAVPPEYTGLAKLSLAQPREPVALLSGSQVTVTFALDQDHCSVQLLRGDDEPLALEPTAGGWQYSFVIDSDLTLELQAENARGFRTAEPVTLAFQVREDQPPSVRLETPSADLEQVAGELLPVRAEIEDDIRLTEFALRYQLNPEVDAEAAFQELPIELETSPNRQYRLLTAFDLEATGATPGDQVLLLLRARDNAGNDGLSRPIMIRVVSFTRGENERLRLQALAFVATALPQVDDSGLIGPESWTALQSAATAHEVTLPAAAQLSSLLTVLEREQHFTDRPQHKRDVRQLHGVLMAGLRLPDGLIAALTYYRHLTNLTWRLYGLRTEAERIHQRLTELAATEEPDPQIRSALRRRSKLYLSTLQDLGDELLTLVRAAAVLDEQRIAELQGELNTAAYNLTRGSVSKNLRACEEVIAAVAQMQPLLPPGYTPLRERERQARAQLHTLTAQAGEPAVEPEAWRSAQCRMLDLNPFAAMTERLALSGHLAAVPAAAAATERQHLDRLAYAWEAAAIAELDGIADDERQLAASLLRQDYATVLTKPAALEPAETAILQAMKLETDWTARLQQASEVGQIASLLDDLGLQLRYVIPQPQAAAANEVLMLRLRAALSRYRLQLASMPASGPAVISGQDGPAAAPPVAENPALEAIGKALITSVGKLTAAYAAGDFADPEQRERIPMLADLERSRKYLETVSRAQQDPLATARQYLQETPEAGLFWLAHHRRDLAPMLDRLATCERLLQQAPLDSAQYGTELANALDELTPLELSVPGAEAVTQLVGEVKTRLARLKISGPTDEPQRQRLLFAIGETVKDLQQLTRQLQSVAEDLRGQPVGFRGGPPGIWEGDLRLHAERSRERLLAQLQLSRREINLGLLSALESAPDDLTAALAWSRFYHRAIRSPLAGPAATRPKQQQQEKPEDRLLNWLLAELAASQKRLRSDDSSDIYGALTAAYLAAMADYLRY